MKMGFDSIYWLPIWTKIASAIRLHLRLDFQEEKTSNVTKSSFICFVIIVIIIIMLALMQSALRGTAYSLGKI